MYVRYMIEHTHVDLLVDYGLDRVNLFGPGILLDATWYVLSKQKNDKPGLYFNITGNQQEKHKKVSLEQAFDDAVNNRKNERVYNLDQSKLRIIEGWPFIYWISDGFREKFMEKSFNDAASVVSGVKTGDNDRLLRYWWELDKKTIAEDYAIDGKAWVRYTKGGTYNKWFGNVWLCVNYYNDGAEIKKSNNYNLLSVRNTFRKGITYSATSTKGVSFRLLEANQLFDMKGSSILFNNPMEVEYAIGILNSNLSFYIANCLNGTVETQVGDIKRIPYIKLSNKNSERISCLSTKNIEVKKHLTYYSIVEKNFIKNPLVDYSEHFLRERIIAYLTFENSQLTLVMLNEALSNQLVFDVYNLSSEDREQVGTKMGKPVGELSVMLEAKNAYLSAMTIENATVRDFIQYLPITTFDSQKIQTVKDEFASLYQSNNDLEEFCIRHQLNPINVWYLFRQNKILPQGRAAEITLEFLADVCRTVLMEDDDGIIPLVGSPGEIRLIDRLEQQCLDRGFTSAQFMQLEGLLGRPLNNYIEQYFFKDFSDHLNLFPNLPKTPFIWHLSSGAKQGFEAYIIIYKWNRDSLYKLKTKYLSKRAESLEYRQIELADSNTAQAQNEKEMIRLQLQEITVFTKKIDELIADGYDPKLDDGVGKNIAPLQLKGMLRSEVLNAKQLEKYLKADW